MMKYLAFLQLLLPTVHLVCFAIMIRLYATLTGYKAAKFLNMTPKLAAMKLKSKKRAKTPKTFTARASESSSAAKSTSA
jgi:hypothetical protein